MLRGAHSEHTTAIWGINVNFFWYTEHTSAIWRIALQIVLQWHTTDVLRRSYLRGETALRAPEASECYFEAYGALSGAILDR